LYLRALPFEFQIGYEVLDAVILNEVANIECDFAMSPMDRKRTVEDRMKLYPGFDGISEWLEDHSLEA
jgi:hypothetical protein